MKQAKAKPYMIGAIRAQLWYPNTGRLSKDILADKKVRALEHDYR
ncbi:MAG: hypothetical protein QM758_15725 [Armatimonas sp.]